MPVHGMSFLLHRHVSSSVLLSSLRWISPCDCFYHSECECDEIAQTSNTSTSTSSNTNTMCIPPTKDDPSSKATGTVKVSSLSTSFDHTAAFFQSIVDNFGRRFVLCLISMFFCLKGVACQLIDNTLLPYYKGLGATGVRYQSYFALGNTPWAMKAAIGLLSDVVPLFGYHKRSYIVLVSVVGSIGLFGLYIARLSSTTAFIAPLLMVLFEYQAASVDLLTEGKYAELMVTRPETGSDIVSFAWGLHSAGTLVGSMLSAVMLSIAPPRYSFLLAIPLAVQVIVPTLSGAFPERKLPVGRRGVRHDIITRHPGMVKLALCMTVGAVLVGGSALFSPTVQSNVSVCVSILIAALGFIWLPKSLRKPNLYLFVGYMLYLSIEGPMDYWMTASPTCVPDGPHFGTAFYVSYSKFVGSIAAILGVVFFQMYLSRGSFRYAFTVAHAIKIGASLFDLLLVTRFNRKLGISDMALFTLGDAVLFQATNRMDLMPSIVLTSKVCTPGMESSVYALLVSYQNLGIAVSRTMGDALVHSLGVRTTEPCNFDRLPWAIFIAHVLLPALVFPLIYILVPDSLMTDDIATEEENNDEQGVNMMTPYNPQNLSQEETLPAEEEEAENKSSTSAEENGERARLLLPQSTGSQIDSPQEYLGCAQTEAHRGREAEADGTEYDDNTQMRQCDGTCT